MRFQRAKTRFLHLSLFNKLVITGSFLTAISVFMPWYEDLDQFRTGDMFLGITGPLYLAGFVILAASALSITLIVFKLIEKKPGKLPMEESHIHVASASLNIFLLILVNSVYFHDKFGVNIALKESRFGMIIAFAGSIMLLTGGLMLSRSSMPDFSRTEGKIEPLIDINDSRSTRNLKSTENANDLDLIHVSEHKKAVQNSVSSTLNTRPGKVDNSANKQPWRMDL